MCSCSLYKDLTFSVSDDDNQTKHIIGVHEHGEQVSNTWL